MRIFQVFDEVLTPKGSKTGSNLEKLSQFPADTLVVHPCHFEFCCGRCTHIKLKKWVGRYARRGLHTKHFLATQCANQEPNHIARHQLATEVLQITSVHGVLNQHPDFDHIAGRHLVWPLNACQAHEASTQADSVTMISIF